MSIAEENYKIDQIKAQVQIQEKRGKVIVGSHGLKRGFGAVAHATKLVITQEPARCYFFI